MKGCEEAFGGGRRGESTVRLRSDGGCEIIPDRPAKVSLLLFSPSFPVSPPSSRMKRVTQRLCRKLLAPPPSPLSQSNKVKGENE